MASIPVPSHRITAMHGEFDFVLVVEKETVFRKLSEANFASKNRCLVVTVRFSAMRCIC